MQRGMSRPLGRECVPFMAAGLVVSAAATVLLFVWQGDGEAGTRMALQASARLSFV